MSGNVAVFESPLAAYNRRLREALEKITKLAGGDPNRPDWDPADAVELVETAIGKSVESEDLRMVTAERRAIARALASAGGNRRRAARILGIGKTTLYRKIDQFGLDPNR